MSDPPQYDEYGIPIQTPAPEPSVLRPMAPANTVLTTGKHSKHAFAKAILAYGENDPEKLQELINEVQQAAEKVVERGSYLTRKLINHTKEAYEVAVELLSEGGTPDPWTRTAVLEYSGQFIELRARVAKGQRGGRVQASTVGGWYSCLVICISKYAYDPATDFKCGPKMLYREGLVDRLLQRVDNVIKTFKLNRHPLRVKRSCGLPEARITIEFLIQSTVNRGRLRALQLICVLIIMLGTGLRPSTLCAGHQEDIEAGKFMSMGDLTFWNRGKFQIDVQIAAKNFKASLPGTFRLYLIIFQGHNTSILGKEGDYWLKALTKSHNIIFDTFWIVGYVFARGGFIYKTIRELVTTQDDPLVLATPEAPLLLACKPGGTELVDRPWTARKMGHAITAASKGAGLENVTSYDYRRGFANDMTVKVGADETSVALGHKDRQTVLSTHYSHAAGNYNLLGIRTGEDTEQYRPGAETALQMRVRIGIAMVVVSKAIARTMSGDPSGDEDESEDETGLNTENTAGPSVEKAIKASKKEDQEFIQKFQEEFRAKDEILQNKEDILKAKWEAYLNTFTRGSPLYNLAKGYKKTNIGILNNIKQHKFYVTRASDPEFRAEAEAAEKELRDANEALRYHFQQAQKKASRQATSLLRERNEGASSTVQAKDAALDYLKGTSSLITDASKALSNSGAGPSPPVGPSGSKSRRKKSSKSKSKSSKAGSSKTAPEPANPPARPTGPLDKETAEAHIASISTEELDESDGEVADVYQQLEKFKLNNLAGGDTLEAAKKTFHQEEEWGDKDQEERLKIAEPYDLRVELLDMALDPIMFERELKAQIQADDGKILCQKCKVYGGSPTSFKNRGNLKRHMWQQHTDWSELILKMESGDRFRCPGGCGDDQLFDTPDKVYEHCVSDDCVDQKAFQMMKDQHDLIQERKYQEQNAPREGGRIQARAARRRAFLLYLLELTEEDLLELAEEFEVPLEDVKPHLKLMLKNANFVATSLL
ncbi:hypothetical protein FRC11_001220 [Ceratobasidium sp. 423]|nr:hypothetical protein FRC11_001220 [Ceratobasidium sp. 423]